MARLRMAVVLGMYSVESRLRASPLCFRPDLDRRLIWLPLWRGRFFSAHAGDWRRPLAPPKGGGMDRNRFLV